MKRIVLLLMLILVLPAYAQTYQTPQELADADGVFVDVNGVSVYYRAAGDPQNPPVVLIHGFGGSTFTWRNTLPTLADAGFYAVALDLPPFGLSDKNPDLDYSRSGMADLVAGLMDTLDIPAATIVGHSMGGAVTAQFAVRHPEKVSRLVFVDGGIFEAPSEDTDDSQATNSNPLGVLNSIDPKSPAAPLLLRTFITRDFYIDTLKSAYYDPAVVTEEVADGYAQLLLIENAPVGFLAYVQATEPAPITLSELAAATVTVPTLLMWGKEDTWVSPVMADRMQAALTQVERVDFPLVGHLPMEEATDAFNEALIAFLQQS